MEGFQGPTNPNLFGEHLNVEQGGGEGSGLDFNSYDAPFVYSESLLRVDEEEVVVVGHHQQQHFSIPSSQDKMPFLQMLQSVESPPFSPFTTTEPHFQLLLTLQQQQQQQKQKQQCNGRWKRKYMSEVVLDSSGSGTTTHPLELESCITHDFSDSHSPVKSETKEQHCPYSWSCPEVVSSLCNNGGEPNSQVVEKGKYSWLHENQSSPKPTTHYFTKPPPNGTPRERERERRKRKRTRPSKNREEVESQRMTHIAVERNRRRQMNDHLNALRSLMPTSFIHRGDQASIIGGAIDFVKELEQLLQSLEAQKRMRKCTKQEQRESSIIPFNGFFTSPQYTTYSSLWDLDLDLDEEEEENKSRVAADIEVIVIQTHVNLKILSPRRPGQLLRAIAALEDIRLTILHLNITSFQTSVLYSFNLKIEDDCKLGSADEIAAAVHQIFS